MRCAYSSGATSLRSPRLERSVPRRRAEQLPPHVALIRTGYFRVSESCDVSSAVEAIYGYLERRTDLSHALVTQTAQPLNQDSH